MVISKIMRIKVQFPAPEDLYSKVYEKNCS
jgi:hypothetical protein